VNTHTAETDSALQHLRKACSNVGTPATAEADAEPTIELQDASKCLNIRYTQRCVQHDVATEAAGGSC
jgi:hypothetical protein